MKFVLVLLLSLGLCACATNDPYTGERKTSNSTKGAGIGAAVGALLGAATSSKQDRSKGALRGAAVGGIVGAGTGHYMDKQEKVLRERLEGTGVRVQRNGKNIKLIMPGNITFATGSAQIRQDFFDVLDSVVDVLKEFKDTRIRISGHTDSVGSDSMNQRLSEERADSVKFYLLDQRVPAGRVNAYGYGERYPIADNGTDAGRGQNRRVELELEPLEN
jgi:outer membrane protein OmpA-like peptidoglycan-associated protein